MILHPDFLDHRKTQKLIKLTGDPASPLILIRLWGYCQKQRQSEFPSSTRLADICHSALPEDQFRGIMIECGFVDPMEAGGVAVHDWNKCNRNLIAAWKNGQKGGNPSQFREKQQPVGNRQATRRLPVGSQRTERLDKTRAGYPWAGTENARTGDSPLPPSSEGLPKEEEKPNPERVKEFGKLLKGLTQKMKTGEPIDPNISVP